MSPLADSGWARLSNGARCYRANRANGLLTVAKLWPGARHRICNFGSSAFEPQRCRDCWIEHGLRCGLKAHSPIVSPLAQQRGRRQLASGASATFRPPCRFLFNGLATYQRRLIRPKRSTSGGRHYDAAARASSGPSSRNGPTRRVRSLLSTDEARDEGFSCVEALVSALMTTR